MSRRTSDADKMTEEDEQAFIMQQITDMLIAAGYFRARISGLDPFDKIVGGMSWAVYASGVPIEMDLQFKENANIGEKIAISENIVHALRHMKCPVHIKPHQIQGLNLGCQPLFPVIQWLVKAVYDHRRSTGDVVRNYSNFLYSVEFNDNHNAADDALSADALLAQQHKSKLDQTANEMGRIFYDDVCSSYALQRQMRKAIGTAFKTRENYVDATLLEYGFKFQASRVLGSGDKKSKDADAAGGGDVEGLNSPKENKLAKFGGLMSQLGHDAAAKKTLPKASKLGDVEEEGGEMETEEEEAKRLAELAKSMEAKGGSKMTGSKLAGLIDSEHVQAGKDTYEEQSDDLQSAAQLRKHDKEFIFGKKKERLTTKLEQLAAAKKKNIEQYKDLTSKTEEIQQSIDDFQSQKKAIDEKMAILLAKENESGNKGLISKLRESVLENERLKRAEADFKTQCKTHALEMQKKIEELEAAELAEDSDEAQRMRKIQKLFAVDSAKYDNVRQALAVKNQELSRLTRQLESYPSRAELLQYEKRFVELYNLTNERLKETKKYYHLYNSLNDVNQSITGEVALLEQIKTEFPKRAEKEQDRAEFIKSLDSFIAKLEESITTAKGKLSEVKKEKDEQSSKFNELLSFQRKYYLLVKEFQNACNINSQLSDRIDIIEAQLEE